MVRQEKKSPPRNLPANIRQWDLQDMLWVMDRKRESKEWEKLKNYKRYV